MSSAFTFALFCFDGEADAKQELESMSIPIITVVMCVEMYVTAKSAFSLKPWIQ